MNSETAVADSDASSNIDAEELLSIEVVYAQPQIQHLIALQLAPGSSLWQAVEQSGLLEQCPELQTRVNELRENVGIFGALKPADTVLKSGDRVEIYRPLVMDPKEARRLRAEKNARLKS